MTPTGAGIDSEEHAQPRPDVRLRDAMPKPLLVTFAVVAVAALGIVIVLMVAPPRPTTIPLGERLSPPRGSLTHDVGRVAPGPVPTPLPSYTPPCPLLSGLRIEAGASGQARLGAAVASLCRLTGGVAPELRTAVLGLKGATLRFGAFDRTGEDATSDLSARTLYVNIRFARANTPTVLVAPVLVHEGWHLANAGVPVTARQEYLARVAELDACRQLIDRDKWIRDCTDADELVSLGEARAVEVLAAAGYER
jgi:hypothetical protein